MKSGYSKFLVCFIFTCFLSQLLRAQGEPIQNPSASGLTRSVDYPVDNSTGLPDISIPLYSMPTRSKDIAINVGLSYHPSAVTSYNEHMGDCGRGWTVIKGGAITRLGQDSEIAWKEAQKKAEQNDTLPVYPIIDNDVLSYNFMGFSGKFRIRRYGNTIATEIRENKGDIIKIIVNFNPQTNSITGFSMYDDKGYHYYFNTVDTSLSLVHYYSPPLNPPPPARHKAKLAFHLTEIFDNNGNSLATFNYYNYETVIPDYHIQGEANNSKVCISVDVAGIGTINFNKNASTKIEEFRYDNVIIRDTFNNVIKRFDFVYPNTINRLIKLIESDASNMNKEIYKFGYVQNLSNGTDKWGYANYALVDCPDNDMPDPVLSKNGVLNSMVLPTGGSVLYEYEANTYSYNLHVGLDLFRNNTDEPYQLNENFYSDLNLFENNHNFNTTQHTMPLSLSQNNKQYTPPYGTTFFRFTGNPYPVPFTEDGSGTAYPSFTLKNSNNTFSQTFAKNNNGNGTNNTYNINYLNSTNNCRGFMRQVADTYTVSISGNTTGSITFTTYILKPQAERKKWWYGGGIRIKNIKYFNDENTAIQHNLYPDNSNYKPVRQINYGYNLFTDQNKSSGSLLNTRYRAPFSLIYFNEYRDVVYGNVTVSEPGSGKTEFTYYTPLDFFEEYDRHETFSYRLGQIKKKKVYNNSGQPVSETDYIYQFTDYESLLPGNNITSSDNIGWIALRQLKTKNYYPEGVIENIQEYFYNGYRKLMSQLTKTSRSSEILKTEYDYHTLNSLYSQNRMELKETRQYKNDELLSKSVINYNNNFDGNNYGGAAGTGNPYYPASISAAKGNGTQEIRLKFNVYDVFGHLLESEQENGSKTVYIYGYNNTQVIAKIENSIVLSSIPVTLINEAKAASDGTDEALLITKLTALRSHASLANAFITTYTHKRLIGVSTVTDARGYKTSYDYDSFGRLKAVKDADGNTLTETEYNLIPQPQN